jgi:adenosylcobyric acid synthase
MSQSGMDKQIVANAGAIPIIGICGGFQMLGKIIIDEGLEGMQSERKVVKGLGLLQSSTVFNSRRKETKQVEKRVTGYGPLLDRLRNQTIRGYEIHMGTTTSDLAIFDDDGAQDDTGLVLGTFLHGLFHNDNLRSVLVEYLLSNHSRRKSTCRDAISESVFKRSLHSDYDEDPYDELARVLEQHVDVEALYSIIGL